MARKEITATVLGTINGLNDSEYIHVEWETKSGNPKRAWVFYPGTHDFRPGDRVVFFKGSGEIVANLGPTDVDEDRAEEEIEEALYEFRGQLENATPQDFNMEEGNDNG